MTPSRAEEIARLLVGWPSVTGTPGEAEFPKQLAAFLAGLPAFGGEVRTIESHGEPRTASIAALARGKGRRTLVFAGHFDVVSIENYLALGHLAFDPDRLCEALIAELEAGPQGESEKRALADLRSGDFLPGRGMADMKSGLAAGLAAIERWTEDPKRAGNILFVATPDEENRSRGMRSFRDALPGLARDWNLDIFGGINLDASEDEGDGAHGRAMFFGTVGKFSPFAHVVGRATHAGYPYGGVSAHLIAAEIVRAIEANCELSDEASGEVSPPPACLEGRDFREAYDVTTPDQVWLLFNWLTHRRRPDELLGLFASIVEKAANEAIGRQAAHGARHGHRDAAWPAVRVIAARDLHDEAERRGGEGFAERHADLLASLATEENPLVISRTIVRRLVKEAALEGPAVVIGFASLYYPHIHVGPDDRPGGDFRRAVLDAASRIAARHGAPIRTAEFFQGISDMSFFGHRPHQEAARLVAAAMLSPDLVDAAPAAALSYPVANIGPWGRQMHQKLERVHRGYAFEVLPDFLLEVARTLLAGTDRAAGR